MPGRSAPWCPGSRFSTGRFTVIRPLAMVDEKNIRRMAETLQFPRYANPCPSAGKTKRSEIKAMLETLYRTNRKIKGNIYRAMSHVKVEYLLK
jgi:tRNA 2-thiocytidine biosynthesis protein TtcA